MNRAERRSPIRRVGVRPQDRAGSETGAPSTRFMADEQVRKEQATPHEPEVGGTKLLTPALSSIPNGGEGVGARIVSPSPRRRSLRSRWGRAREGCSAPFRALKRHWGVNSPSGFRWPFRSNMGILLMRFQVFNPAG
jgi:hypothetical protein